MTSLRRAAALATVTLAVAAVRAAYAARGDVLVGQVDDANEKFAAVSGIDPAAVKKGDTVSFVDVSANRIFSNGTVNDTSAAGRLIVEYDKQGERAPRTGDLCVKPK